MNSALRFAAPLVLASLVLSLSACKPENKEDTAKTETDAPAAKGDDAPIVPGIAGLETGQEAGQLHDRPGHGQVAVGDQGRDRPGSAVPGHRRPVRRQGVQADRRAGAQGAGNASPPRIQAKQAAEAEAKAAKGKEEGAAFLAANKDKPGVKVTDSGLQYQVVRAGNGPKPAATDVVRVHYKGTLLDGTVFDSSYDRGQPAEFGLAQVIPGWSEGVALMPVGSKYTFWIPAELGYGEAGGGPIPPNAMLTFEVELMEIVK